MVFDRPSRLATSPCCFLQLTTADSALLRRKVPSMFCCRPYLFVHTLCRMLLVRASIVCSKGSSFISAKCLDHLV